MREVFLLSLLLWPFLLSAQTIEVRDSASHEPLIGAHIVADADHQWVTDALGKAQLNLSAGPLHCDVSFIGYKTRKITLQIHEGQTYVIWMQADDIMLNEAVITGSKYEISAAKSTVTIDVISPELIKRNNANSVDKVLQRMPGVDVIDNQPNIRGGSGFSYGAGSRVLVLLDDIPILQADAGYPNWNDLPIELTGQIEVLKGAASTYYGSSALNGVINLRTAYAGSKPETGYFVYSTLYSAAKNQRWWNKNIPMEFGYSLYHKARVNKTDLVFGAFAKHLRSYNKGTTEDYNRISGSINHHPNERLSFGFNFNVNLASSSKFFYWKSLDSLYVGAKGTESTSQGQRINIDPHLSYYDKKGNRHRLLSRFHYVDNHNNAGRSNQSKLGYLEYQLYHPMPFLRGNLTTGIVNIANSISAPLYGDTSFSTLNNAVYAQIDMTPRQRLKLSAGIRYENNNLYAPEYFNCHTDPFSGEMVCDTIPNGRKHEARPVLRAGMNYQTGKAGFLRASWGQGYRYPTVAEQFIRTTFGGILISPNVKLHSETGWSAEVAYRQGFKLRSYKGYVDGSLFWSAYQHMIEFNFIDLSTTGFQSVNVGNTNIKGVELIWAGEVASQNWKVSHLIGFNHINPRFAQFDTSAQTYTNPTTEGQRNAYNSSSKQNVLKYRFRTTVKYDVQLSYKKWSVGSSGNYYSYMQAIDAIFEDFVVPGLAKFRETHQKGVYIINVRAGFEISAKANMNLLVNNLLNTQYSMRPGLMEAPRNTSVRLQVKF
ncbi:TonB-dependent receptor plug domain-containing protein [bacterium]|nr:TonB-dependent receptor plug domain-containing protein [bacterium]